MKRILFVTYTGESSASSGIEKKVKWQIEAFEKHGFEVSRSTFDNSNNLISIRNKKRVLLAKKIPSFFCYPFIRVFAICVISYFLIKKFLENNNVEFVYIRKHFYIEPLLANLLKRFRPDLQIFLEIPTYPYQSEFFHSFKGLILALLDMLVRAFFCSSVDRIVTFSSHKTIWHVKTITTGNGYDVAPFNRKQTLHPKIVFTTVAYISSWHGIDRFLKSLERYHKLNVVFNIVGEGPGLADLRKIVDNNHYLKQVVLFHGWLANDSLEKVYQITDIAVGSLGRHRCGIKSLQPLKNREYLAMGLPIIFSTKDPLIPWSLPFIYEVPDDESIICIEKILEWFDNGSFDSEAIHCYARKNLSWHRQVEPIVEASRRFRVDG